MSEKSTAEKKNEQKVVAQRNETALAFIACSYDSSSGNDTDDECDASKKRLKVGSDCPVARVHGPSSPHSKLPLPPSLVDMYAESNSTDVDDQEDQHAGRIRSFPHERGNWATYVYVHYPLEPELEQNINNFLSALPLELQPCGDFHISLSKTVILKYHWIQPFVDHLKSTLRTQKRFHVSLPQLEVYTNDELTRTFLGLKVEGGNLHLQRLVSFVDDCLTKYRLPEFYKDPSFHLSIGWCSGDRSRQLRDQLPAIQVMRFVRIAGKSIFSSHFQECSSLCLATINCVKCKTGDKLFNLPLLSS